MLKIRELGQAQAIKWRVQRNSTLKPSGSRESHDPRQFFGQERLLPVIRGGEDELISTRVIGTEAGATQRVRSIPPSSKLERLRLTSPKTVAEPRMERAPKTIGKGRRNRIVSPISGVITEAVSEKGLQWRGTFGDRYCNGDMGESVREMEVSYPVSSTLCNQRRTCHTPVWSHGSGASATNFTNR